MQRLSIASLIAVGIFIGWACGDAVPNMFPDAGADAGDDGSVSGTRIEVRPIVYTGDDGSVIHAGEEYFDTERGARCYPLLAEDGKMRCLPQSEGWTLRGTTFADSGCTTRIVYWVRTCEEPTMYFAEPGNVHCYAYRGTRVYEVEVYDGQLYSNESGECVPVEDSIADTFQLATIGTEVLPSEWVELVR